MKLILQRKIEIWVEDVYEVDKIDEDSIQKAIDYDYDSLESDVLWETQYDLGPYKIYDENYKLVEEYV